MTILTAEQVTNSTDLGSQSYKKKAFPFVLSIDLSRVCFFAVSVILTAVNSIIFLHTNWCSRNQTCSKHGRCEPGRQQSSHTSFCAGLKLTRDLRETLPTATAETSHKCGCSQGPECAGCSGWCHVSPVPPGGVWLVFAARRHHVPLGTLISPKALSHSSGNCWILNSGKYSILKAEFSFKYTVIVSGFSFRCNSLAVFTWQIFFAYFIKSVRSLFNSESQALDWLHVSSALPFFQREKGHRPPQHTKSLKGFMLNINLKLVIKSQEVPNLMPEQRLKKKSARKPDSQSH